MITSDRKQSQTSHRFKAFEELKNSPDVPLLPLPNLQVFLEDSAARRNITHDPTFNTILTQIKLVLYHLIASEGAFTDIRYIIEKIIQNVEAAKAALGRRLGSNREFVRQDLCNFLQRDTPAIIFKSTVLQSWNWGFVNKGEEVGAAENELFLSMDLMQALQNPATQDLLNISQDLLDQQKLRLSVLWKITFMHELMHATTKYFLSPEVITPNIPGLEADGEGHGEAGWSLENWYLGYKLEAIWMKEDVEKPHQMWLIHELLGRCGGQCLELTSNYLDRLDKSFSKRRLWAFTQENLPVSNFVFNTDFHIRRRGLVPVGSDEGTDPFDGPEFVMITTGSRGARRRKGEAAGLGLQLP